MENSKAKKIVRKYKLVSYGLALLVAILSMTAAYLGVEGYLPEVAALLIVAVLVAAGFIGVRKATSHFLLGPLTNEGDINTYEEIFHQSKLLNHTWDSRLTSLLYRGEYRKILEFTRDSTGSAPILVMLARVYYVLGDDEALSNVCRKFEALSEKRKRPYKVMRFFEAVVAGNPEEAVRITYELEENKKFSGALHQASYAFFRGVCLYRSGELDGARASFIKTIASAPEIHYSAEAREYLEAMDRGEKYIPEPIVLHDEEEEIEDDYFWARGGNRIYSNTFSILLLSALMALSTLFAGEATPEKQEMSEFELAVLEVVTEKYGECGYDYRPLYVGEVYEQAIIFVVDANGDAHVGTLGYNQDEELGIYPYAEKAEPGQRYVRRSIFENNKYLGFTVYTKNDIKKMPKEGLLIFSVKGEGGKRFLVIDYFGTDPEGVTP